MYGNLGSTRFWQFVFLLACFGAVVALMGLAAGGWWLLAHLAWVS